MATTTWFDLPGFKGFYQLSTTGRVRNVKTEKLIAVQYTGTPMARVRLSRDGREVSVRVDRLRDVAASLRNGSRVVTVIARKRSHKA